MTTRSRGAWKGLAFQGACMLAALSSIVARVREPVTFSSASEWKRVACIYLCG